MKEQKSGKSKEMLSPFDLRIAFFASNNGTDMAAILAAIADGSLQAEPECLITNNSDSRSRSVAERFNIPSYHVSEKTLGSQENVDDTIVRIFDRHTVSIGVCSGYMKQIGKRVFERVPILNVHPALLPAHGGQGMYGDVVHKAVLNSGEKITGPTIHLVDEEYDHGKVLGQSFVSVLPEDSVASLREKVQEEEKLLYISILNNIQRGRLIL